MPSLPSDGSLIIQQVTPKARELFKVILFLTSFLLLQEIILSGIDSVQIYGLLHSYHSSMGFPWILVPPLLYAFFAVFLLHLGFAGFVFIFTYYYSRVFNYTEKQSLWLSFFFFMVLAFLVLLLNQWFFPLSQFAEMSAQWIPDTAAKIISVALLIFLLMAAVPIVGYFFYRLGIKKTMIGGLLILVFLLLRYSEKFFPSNNKTSMLPNIIVLGIDSLRPNDLNYYGGHLGITPFLDSLLTRSINFSEAIVPLARTFSSWTSMLTGLNPETNGAVEDLVKPTELRLQTVITKRLKSLGYETIFAIDDNQFSNFTGAFSFDKIITSTMGVNNFILSVFNDFPLANLVINTRLGAWLFPYNYINRQTLPTYYPATFNRAIQRYLEKPRQHPLFLVVHYCLPHYPYLWAKKLMIQQVPKNTREFHATYHAAVAETDHTLAELWQFLTKQHYLDNAIVVLLSDHGEALGDGERIVSPETYEMPKDISTATQTLPFSKLLNILTSITLNPSFDYSYGHGTDLLSLNQYHALLSFLFTGAKAKQFVPHDVPVTVSLTDLQPTLLNLLQQPLMKTEGVSLLPYLQHAASSPSMRDFYLMSGLDPRALLYYHPLADTELTEAGLFFEINKRTGFLELRQDMLPILLQYKQYGMIHHHWLFVVVPQKKGAGIPVLVDLQSGAWTTRLSSPLARQADAETLLKKLKAHFGAVITVRKDVKKQLNR